MCVCVCVCVCYQQVTFHLYFPMEGYITFNILLLLGIKKSRKIFDVITYVWTL